MFKEKKIKNYSRENKILLKTEKDRINHTFLICAGFIKIIDRAGKYCSMPKTITSGTYQNNYIE
jgi:hypothetical protein